MSKQETRSKGRPIAYTVEELERWNERILDLARDCGLDLYPQEFEICDHEQMLAYTAYSGMPSHYPHWSYGKSYEKLKTLYDYGISGLPYEMVINSNPCIAYLMRDNTLLLQVLTMAHVYGHNDFFKNNFTFKLARPEFTIEIFKTHAHRVRRYVEDPSIGLEKVERLLDAAHALSLQCRRNLAIRKQTQEEEEERRLDESKPSTDPFQSIHRRQQYVTPDLNKVPLYPDEDILIFIRDHNPYFSDWEKDLLTIVHEEAQYFIPQIDTKIMNEGWACATGDTLIFTEQGLMRFDELYASRQKLRVASGDGAASPVADFHMEPNALTLRIVTRRGYEIEGALDHRLLRADGSWTHLRELKLGDRVRIDAGANLWPTMPLSLDYEQACPHPTLTAVAVLVGVSLYTVLRHLRGRRVLRATEIDAALVRLGYRAVPQGRVLAVRRPLKLPSVLNESLAYVLGYFVGDGHVSKSGIGITCGQREHAEWLAQQVAEVTGIPASVRWDASSLNGRARIEVHSRELKALLAYLGVRLESKAKEKTVPKAILRSPRSVVSAFLRGYFDADAYAGKEGVILVTASAQLCKQVQILLLNYGIFSSRSQALDGTYRLRITSSSAQRFNQQIGFKLAYKQRGLTEYIGRHRWYKEEEPADKIIRIENGQADIFDIMVAERHAYVGNGFVNHNSYWHKRILEALDLPQEMNLEFIVRHTQVLSPTPGGLNPYHLGMKVWEDIERRWNHPTAEEEREYGPRKKGGKAKIFEVREVERDSSFLRRYLTEELIRELNLFEYQHRGGERVVNRVADRESWGDIKETLIRNVGMGTIPVIRIEDADYNNNRVLFLKHCHDGRDLHLEYAERTLQYLHQLWRREVVLETVINEKKSLLCFSNDKLVIKPLH